MSRSEGEGRVGEGITAHEPGVRPVTGGRANPPMANGAEALAAAPLRHRSYA
jgi:hypothetical protein